MPKEEQLASHFPSPETLQKFAEKDALLLCKPQKHSVIFVEPESPVLAPVFEEGGE